MVFSFDLVELVPTPYWLGMVNYQELSLWHRGPARHLRGHPCR